MKYHVVYPTVILLVSHLTRGAWIEITNQKLTDYAKTSHLTRGAWIEISRAISPYKMDSGRTSHEVRGLKYGYGGKANVGTKSHLTRGAWIEI